MGGGLFVCNGTISGNEIEENSCQKFGGGLAYCDGLVENNRIAQNSAPNHGGGLYRCDGEIRSNLIVGNQALGGLGMGGGLSQCGWLVENNTIVQNTATVGGGLYGCDGMIWNCIVWANTAPGGAQVFSGSTPTYSCIQNWTGGGEGNTSVNPVFVDADGPDNNPNTFDDNNYRLMPYMQNSVCIDKGKNQPWMTGARDLDGNLRVFHGLSSNTVDMGAYEYGSWLFKVVAIRKNPAGQTGLTWYSRPLDTYVVWSRPALYYPESIHVPWGKRATVSSQGFITSWTDPGVPYPRLFYRVELKR